ncbi:MAG: sigma-54 interaction domain-containing protein [Bdellovibrionota bacterium]
MTLKDFNLLKNFQNFEGIISNCKEMQDIFKVIEKVSKTDTTILILGESGTGKELIAKAIHTLSKRTGRLVPVNCAAIPEEILESELFGHEKGAFTGAISNKLGRFELANNGTIFLDEIGEMSPKLQAKLLRVLQDGKVDPVGSTKSIDVNIRVVAATNQDLKELVKEGRFREDLYYRLQVVPIELPALRERNNDISLLAEYFVSYFADKFSKEIKIKENAIKALNCYNWPGNVRELENLSERLVVLADNDEIDITDLPSYILSKENQNLIKSDYIINDIPNEGLDFNSYISNIEDNLIKSALNKTKGNKKAAAELLKLNRTTLVEKIKKKNITYSTKKENIKKENIRKENIEKENIEKETKTNIRPNFGTDFGTDFNTDFGTVLESKNVSFSRSLQDI